MSIFNLQFAQQHKLPWQWVVKVQLTGSFFFFICIAKGNTRLCPQYSHALKHSTTHYRIWDPLKVMSREGKKILFEIYPGMCNMIGSYIYGSCIMPYQQDVSVWDVPPVLSHHQYYPPQCQPL